MSGPPVPALLRVNPEEAPVRFFRAPSLTVVPAPRVHGSSRSVVRACTMLGLVGLVAPVAARAEGLAQVGSGQELEDDTVMYVDILASSERITWSGPRGSAIRLYRVLLVQRRHERELLRARAGRYDRGGRPGRHRDEDQRSGRLRLPHRRELGWAAGRFGALAPQHGRGLRGRRAHHPHLPPAAPERELHLHDPRRERVVFRENGV